MTWECINDIGLFVTAFYVMHFFDLDIIILEHAIMWVILSIGAGAIWPLTLSCMVISDIICALNRKNID